MAGGNNCVDKLKFNEVIIANVKDLIGIVYDTVIIYKANDEGFEEIYNGDTYYIPLNILEMKVRSVGSKKRGIIDIQVF